MQCVDVSIALLGDLFADFLKSVGHFEGLVRLHEWDVYGLVGDCRDECFSFFFFLIEIFNSFTSGTGSRWAQGFFLLRTGVWS